SGYHRFIMNLCRYSHRGLPPHYIAPMLGAHPSIERTSSSKLRLLPVAAHVIERGQDQIVSAAHFGSISELRRSQSSRCASFCAQHA
ncbi:MAG: hypothetical protein WCF44_06880, partial [Candidatus Methylophosphatis roskildensis]